MERIFLIGYMGSGKTTLGKAFARAMNLQFIDLDWYIEERLHKTITELFAERGEDGFRIIEKNMLHEAGEFEDIVIAAGGGTPCFFDNMTFMNHNGDTVFLEASEEALLRRLKAGKSKRPLLAKKTDDELKATITTTLKNRMPFYQQAKYTFCSDNLESKEQIERSVECLKQLLNK